MTIPITVTVNGRPIEQSVEPRLLLVHFLREVAGLTGTKVGCDTSQCGSCTVLRDGVSIKACTLLAVQADGSSIMTIEGLAPGEAGTGAGGGQFHKVQTAFWDKHGLQCGFCTPGMILATVDFLNRFPHPTTEQIRHGLEGNMCRCTGYQNIVRAVAEAAGGAAK